MKYYRFWIADFESKTNALSNSQRGIYLLLLNHCYMHEHGLPADLGTVYLISRAISEADRADVMLVLGTYFQRQDDGSYRNGKCEQLLSEMRQYSDAQKERSALGVAARQAKSAPRSTKANGKAHPIISGFDAFWDAYPRHIARAAALKVWTKIAPDDVLQGRIMDALSVQRTWGDWLQENGKFIPHPTTWLNQRRWEDEPPRPQDTRPVW